VSDRELDRYEGLALADQVVIDRLCSCYEMALRVGEDPSLEEYLQKPGVSDPACLLIELVAIDRTYRSGGSLSRDDYVARFPDFAAAIDEAFQSGSATRVRPSPQSPHRAACTPPAIDGYEILGELGRGGMGVVYKARHRGLRRLVAVKVILSAHLGSVTGHARLRLEAELAARVQHPNIVAVHEVGSHDGGPFLSMEWVDGGTLAAHAGQPWPANLAADLVRTLARAVHAAHSQGVIHRDLKPANVLLQELPAGAAVAGAVTLPGGGLVVPKVADFSLALLVESGENLTSTGRVIGTPAYMAPEQARGDRARVGPATDVYALGVILYELLTSRLPFHSGDPMALLLAITTADPRAPRRLRPQVPRDLDTVCMKCLEKEPDRRYPSAAALADDLARFLEDQPILAQRPTFPQIAARWARRHRTVVWAAALASLVGLVVLAGSAGWVVRDRAARQARTRTEVQAALDESRRLQKEGKWSRARGAAGQAQALLGHGAAEPELAGRVEALLRELAEQEADEQLVVELAEIRLLQADTVKRFGAPEYRPAFKRFGFDVEAMKPEESAALILRRPAAVRASLIAALDHWLFEARNQKSSEADGLERVLSAADADVWRRRLRAALRTGDRQVLEKLAREDDVLVQHSQSLELLAIGLRVTGNSEEGLVLLKRAQEAFPDDFWINYNLGVALSNGRPPRLDEAIRFFAVAVALRQKSPAARLNLGMTLGKSGRYHEARIVFRKVLELEPTWASVYDSIGNSLLAEGKDLEGAIACYRKAIALDPKIATTHSNLGLALSTMGKVDEAIKWHKKAIQLDPKNAPSHYNLGRALQDKGKLEEALACYRKATSLDPRFLPAVDQAVDCCRKVVQLDPKNAQAYSSLGLALQGKGKLDEAIACYRKAIALEAKLALAHYNLGVTLQQKGQLAEAITCYRRTVTLDPNYPEAHCNLGLLLREQGQLSESLDLLRRGHALGSKRPGWPYPSATWAHQAERLVLLEKNLPNVLAGKLRPAAAEQIGGESAGHLTQFSKQKTMDKPRREAIWSHHQQIEYARLARLLRRHRVAVRLFAEAFAAEPKLAVDPRSGHRYVAARSAALAAAGQGKDAAGLASGERVALRRQALTWLRAELAAWARLVGSGTPADRTALQQMTQYCQHDPELAGLRDPAAVAKLPPAERQACQQFWADVQALRSKANAAGKAE
jgi:serine/threonine-protein kinase